MTKEKEQIKLKLIVMNFLQFFIWGAWLISMGRYMGNVMQYDGQEVGGLFATAGFAAIITPAPVSYTHLLVRWLHSNYSLVTWSSHSLLVSTSSRQIVRPIVSTSPLFNLFSPSSLYVEAVSYTHLSAASLDTL